MILAGIGGICFTYQNTAREKITTPKDAYMPNMPVRGPFTLKVQADVIRMHTLKSTDGKVFSEMPRQIEKLDAGGKPIIGTDGKPVMVPNTTRDMWITATTLMTALNLGIIAYAFSAFAILVGVLMIWAGVLSRLLARHL